MPELNAWVMRENAQAGPVKFSITGARYRHRSLYTEHVMIKRTRHDCSDKFYNANESRKNRVKKPYSSLLRDYLRGFTAYYREPPSQ